MTDPPHIRLATLTDLPDIVDIYNQAIRSKTATGDLKEFTVEERVDWFNKFDGDHFPIYVAVYNNKIAGYATLSAYRPGREAMRKIAEISFYLNYDYHGQGIGTALLEYAIADCKRIQKETLLAILLDINIKSVGLLEKFGFEKWGHLPKIVDLVGEECGQFIYGLDLRKK